MLADIRNGLAGHYDEIYANVNHDVFAAMSREPGARERVGQRPEPTWWAGEHEGYWKDGFVRLAFLTRDKASMDRARKWMEAIVQAQGPDGYIGIYNPETRLKTGQAKEGELWTQTRIFQAMLGYYEFTGDADILAAVEKAVHLTLARYAHTSYFAREGRAGGSVTHGIAFSDTLEQLYRLTGNPDYRDGERWLYDDFNRSLPDADTALECLLDPDQRWQGHTPHIMEGLAIPQILYAMTGEEQYRQAAINARRKLAWHTTPGGGVVGDESVRGRMGTGSTLCEYCSFTEGVIAMNQILAYSGDLAAGDWVERACLNGAQGARFHPANRATAYFSRDNQRTTDDGQDFGGRTYFSACHTHAACCTLNSTRLMPYYVQGMWYRPSGAAALAANLYGPCRLETRVHDTMVRISEETAYPFEDDIVFKVNPERPIELTLIFRIPEGARQAVVDAGAEAEVTRERGRVAVRKRWERGDRISLHFDFEIQLRESHDHQFYYRRGPLVFALKFQEKKQETRKFVLDGRDSGFREYILAPKDDSGWNLLIDKSAVFRPVQLRAGDLRHPWVHPPIGLEGQMRDADGKAVNVVLVPEGTTLLRRLTFPATKTVAN